MNETQTNDACLRLENQLCFPLYACAKEVVRQYREPLQALNLTYTQYIVMMVLWEFGEMTEGEIGKKVHLDSGTLAPLLKRLQKIGYINRVRPEGNENKLIISLTSEGEQLKKMAIKVPSQMQGCIPLSEKDMILLRELLNRALVGMNIDRR
nr:MarR family transcriptional regulator [uncultured Ruminococcus sp.]